MNPMVPVGAMTVVCAFRNPFIFPVLQASFQHCKAASKRAGGTRRLSSQTLVDLRLSRPISFGATRVELLVDVLNALNDTAEEGVATDNLFSPTFGQPTAFVDPRRAMIGVRINVGQ